MARRRPGGLTAEAFNQQHEVGTAFRYYPVAGCADFTETRTRSEAWTLGGGEPVVLIEGLRSATFGSPRSGTAMCW
jgi:hypothetical protein